jgi:hypothetical protein
VSLDAQLFFECINPFRCFSKRIFLELVTDENLRETMARKSEPLRNLILSLAFGSLAQPVDKV